MPKSQQVLSKAQEQLDYATSRCGNLMKQLDKIKNHMNWKNIRKENLADDESSEDDGKRDRTTSIKGITERYYKDEFTTQGTEKANNEEYQRQPASEEEDDGSSIEKEEADNREDMISVEKHSTVNINVHKILSQSSLGYESVSSNLTLSSPLITSEDEQQVRTDSSNDVISHEGKQQNEENTGADYFDEVSSEDDNSKFNNFEDTEEIFKELEDTEKNTSVANEVFSIEDEKSNKSEVIYESEQDEDMSDGVEDGSETDYEDDTLNEKSQVVQRDNTVSETKETHGISKAKRDENTTPSSSAGESENKSEDEQDVTYPDEEDVFTRYELSEAGESSVQIVELGDNETSFSQENIAENVSDTYQIKSDSLHRLASPMKINLFTSEVSPMHYIQDTNDLDQEIEVIEINANNFDHSEKNDNGSKEKIEDSSDSEQLMSQNNYAIRIVEISESEEDYGVKIEDYDGNSVEGISTICMNPIVITPDDKNENIIKDNDKTKNLSKTTGRVKTPSKSVVKKPEPKMKKPKETVPKPEFIASKSVNAQKKKKTEMPLNRKQTNATAKHITDKVTKSDKNNKNKIEKTNQDTRKILSQSKKVKEKGNLTKKPTNLQNITAPKTNKNVNDKLSVNTKKAQVSAAKSNKAATKTEAKTVTTRKVEKNLNNVGNKINANDKKLPTVKTSSDVDLDSSPKVITKSLFDSIKKTIQETLKSKDMNDQTNANTNEPYSLEKESLSQKNTILKPVTASRSLNNPKPVTASRSLYNPKPESANRSLNNPKPVSTNRSSNKPEPVSANRSLNNPKPISKASNTNESDGKQVVQRKNIPNNSTLEESKTVETSQNTPSTMKQINVNLFKVPKQKNQNAYSKTLKTESVQNISLTRLPIQQENNKRPESESRRNISNINKSKNWDENNSSDFGRTFVRPVTHKGVFHQTISQGNIHANTNVNHINAYNRDSNVKIAQSLGFNSIPFIVGQSTSKSYHIGLNIQQTLSLMNLSPSLPTLKVKVESIDGSTDKDSSIGNLSSATYKPKICPACSLKPHDNREEDEIYLEDPWHVPQIDSWDYQSSIANRRNLRCTCLPNNIISFNEVLTQMFQAEGLMASKPVNSGTNISFNSGQELEKYEKERRNVMVRKNNASYLTRLLRNIQRIQNQYIVPITKLPLNGFKYSTN